MCHGLECDKIVGYLFQRRSFCLIQKEVWENSNINLLYMRV